EGAQENTAKAERYVLVDNIARAIQACICCCHDGADLVSAQTLAYATNPLKRPRMTVTTGTRSVAIVQVRRTIKRSRYVDRVVPAKGQDFIAYDRKICRDHEAKISFFDL